MEKVGHKVHVLYEFIPVGGGKAFPVKKNKKRLLIGNNEAADVLLPYDSIDGIQAVIEFEGDHINIYDMNSSLGTFVNNHRVLKQKISFSDEIKFGNVSFVFKKFSSNDIAPPIIDSLDIELPKEKSIEMLNKAPPVAPVSFKKKSDLGTPVKSRIDYPLSSDPKAEFSEYIFEDVETLFPIFKYQVDKTAVEIIILFKGKILSVDYIPDTNGLYYLIGKGDDQNEIEYPYLGKNERRPFIEVRGEEVYVYQLDSHDFSTLSDHDYSDTVEKSHLLPNDIFRFLNNDLQIFVRGTEAPPLAKHAPIFGHDHDLKKYFLLMLILVGSFLTALSTYQVDEELEKEKAQERVARIL